MPWTRSIVTRSSCEIYSRAAEAQQRRSRGAAEAQQRRSRGAAEAQQRRSRGAAELLDPLGPGAVEAAPALLQLLQQTQQCRAGAAEQSRRRTWSKRAKSREEGWWIVYATATPCSRATPCSSDSTCPQRRDYGVTCLDNTRNIIVSSKLGSCSASSLPAWSYLVGG